MNNHMKLVADSGSTKTDWAIGNLRFKTQGINPFHQDDEAILKILSEELLPQVKDYEIQEICFYGSGVRQELEDKMTAALRKVFPSATSIEAHNDLLGAAKALCGDQEGIACILGTGSNSCIYDGRAIVSNTPALGYILGDEGSGAVQGKRFLNALYKNRLPEQLKREFELSQQMTMADVIARVYKQPMPNRWLASLSTFISKHQSEEAVHQLIVDNFSDFFRFNINPYDRRDLPVSAVGSIAFYYESQLREAAEKEGYVMGKIMRSPIDGLV